MSSRGFSRLSGLKSSFIEVTRFILKNRFGLIGVIILSFFIIVALFPRLFTPYTSDMDFRREILRMGGEVPYPPTPDHPLGVDHRGRDIWCRVVYGQEYR